MGFRSVGVEVIVPATSANLGPGFDSLGLALPRLHELHRHLREHLSQRGLPTD